MYQEVLLKMSLFFHCLFHQMILYLQLREKQLLDPFAEVDLPYMLLRLRQGIGRLIRTQEDKGCVHILINSEEKNR